MNSATNKCLRSRQTGVSLVELMVGVVVGLILIGGLLQVYLSTKQSYNAQEQLARMQEGGRFAMDLITRDLRRAGYWGGNVDTLTFAGDPGPLNPPTTDCAGNSDDDWGRAVAWRVSGLNNDNSNFGCAINYVSDTDIFTVRYAGPETVTVDPATPERLYLRSTLFLARILRGSSVDNPLNELPPTEVGTPEHLLAAIRPLIAHAYYVADSGDTCNGATIPSLNRVRLNEMGRPVSEEIARGVEQLQVRYLFNNQYVDADAVGGNWRDVRAVRVWLLMRGECRESGLENDSTYTMGDTSWAVSDNFRRQLFTSTVMLRNTIVR